MAALACVDLPRRLSDHPHFRSSQAQYCTRSRYPLRRNLRRLVHVVCQTWRGHVNASMRELLLGATLHFFRHFNSNPLVLDVDLPNIFEGWQKLAVNDPIVSNKPYVCHYRLGGSRNRRTSSTRADRKERHENNFLVLTL
jgi:hypothetical protein